MATARDDNTDAQPSETHEADSAAIMSAEADDFLAPPIENAAEALVERLHRQKLGLCVRCGYDLYSITGAYHDPKSNNNCSSLRTAT